MRSLGKVYEPWGRVMNVVMRSQVPEPVIALHDITFDVHAGEVCVVVGPNGAGKSTLFRILTGLTTPTTGSASIMGIDVDTDVRRTRRLVGFMPSDDRSLGLRISCWENLAFHARLQGIPKAARPQLIDETLEMVGLAHARDRAGFALSSGMRARLQLGRALLHRPKVVILDEPTGTVDPVDAHKLLELIQTLCREQEVAVLISSHRLEEIDALSDNAAFLDRGRLVHWGSVASLRSLWDAPRAQLTFRSRESAGRAYERLCEIGAEQPEWDHELTVRVIARSGAGALFEPLGSLLGDVDKVTEEMMPLRDVLARLASENRTP